MIGISNMVTTKKKDNEVISPSELIGHSLLENHIFFLSGEIDEFNIREAIEWITYENFKEEEGKILTLYVNSGGGDLYQAFALIDVMKQSKYPIRTIGIGSIFSAAFLIFSAGTRGKRIISKNTGIMCHQFSEEAEGKYHDIKAHMKEADLCNQRMVNILCEATGLDVKTVKTKLLPPTDSWLKAEQLISLGVADSIL